ncbi:molecular chaperone DnaK [Platysternon megacephalum]|uniref:pyridoxal 5'-phosphate synthase n=1 Tax=Platysternon megacephalum TaxID=55544 RepID=A0A4D9DGS3_9SAUR|nr:molecular chaperone DnaK [Platysternon megacephalum]
MPLHLGTDEALSLDTLPDNPMVLVMRWLEQASEHGVVEPRSASLATFGVDGPSSRMVTIRTVDRAGCGFSTSATSRKGVELSHDPRCSVNFYWREVGQQVTVAGEAFPCRDAESDEEFYSWPESAQAALIASQQSSPLGEVDLPQRAADIMRTGVLTRPAQWGRWRVTPHVVEFWQGHGRQFPERVQYRSAAGAKWEVTRLQP